MNNKNKYKPKQTTNLDSNNKIQKPKKQQKNE